MKDKENFRNNKFPVVYAHIYPLLVDVARECGYALGLHGSLRRDLDLIACPWTNEAISAEELKDKILDSLNGVFVHEVGKMGIKPHGRVVYTIFLDNHGFIDLSIMPKHESS